MGTDRRARGSGDYRVATTVARAATRTQGAVSVPVPGDSGPRPKTGSTAFATVSRSASGVAVPVVAGMGLSFVLSVALARWLGPVEFGMYVIVMAWVAVLGTVCTVGLDTTLVRQLPVYTAEAAWNLMGGLLRWANRVTVVVSIAAVGLAQVAWLLTFGPRHWPPAVEWIVAGLLVPLAALLRLQQSTLRGLRQPALGQIPESILVPLLVLGLVGVWAWTGLIPPTAGWAVLAQSVGAGIALAVAILLVRRAIPAPARRVHPRHAHRQWLIASGRMVLLAGLTLLNGRIGILILGVIAVPEVAAQFAVALRGSGFIPLALNMTVLAVAPAIARAHALGDMAGVERLARQMTRFALIGGVPIAAAFLLLGRWFLLLFGPGFEVAHGALVILILGELVNVSAGPVATLLVMTGHERDATLGLAASTALNAAMTLLLVPAWGVTGAAVAAAAGVIAWNVILWRVVHHRLGFTPSIFGVLVSRGMGAPHD